MQDGFSSEVNLISLWWLQAPFLKKKQSLQVYTSGIMYPQASSLGFASVYKSLPRQYGNYESSSFNNTQSLQVYLVCSMFLTFYPNLNIYPPTWEYLLEPLHIPLIFPILNPVLLAASCTLQNVSISLPSRENIFTHFPFLG